MRDSVLGLVPLLFELGKEPEAPAHAVLVLRRSVPNLGAEWVKGVAVRGRLAAARGAWLVFEDEAGFSMTPPQAKTWSQRGRTPLVRVRGRSRRRRRAPRARRRRDAGGREGPRGQHLPAVPGSVALRLIRTTTRRASRVGGAPFAVPWALSLHVLTPRCS